MPIRGAPGTGINTIRSPLSPLAPNSSGKVRVSQQYVEVINDGGANKVRVSQQYIEVVNSGGDNRVRLSQQYLEIICTFGTPPPSPPDHGKKGDPPGKRGAAYLAKVEHRRARRETRRLENDTAAFIPQQYLSPVSGSSTPGLDAVDWRQGKRRISISPTGHIVRNN